ncbi:ABC transporter substrate-binding protein [Pseudomonas nicosulfuronedens]|uniref:ABC transporter substrate-binding protein n=1 Tax=Pseudomonas nicosulfuronedens TaxID=2571105 RepID=A0A5R9QTY7_9PSED|nr:ABC transporter substrate-binding protein [Pseudomonas nicosulfuronedens]
MIGLREEREAGRRLARRIAGLFEQGMGRRAVRDERFQRRVERRGRPVVKSWRAGFALTPTLSRGERGLGGSGWRVWSTPACSLSCVP